MPPVSVDYRYEAASSMTLQSDHTELGLASTDAGTFLDAFVERADAVAAGLLRVGEVAATRFYVHPALTRAKLALADPIITVGDGVVRFESLSACCGVAARLDLPEASLATTTWVGGTTNVDLGPAMRRLLAGLRRRHPLRVVVGSSGLELQTLAGRAQERVVDLPTRWVRSLAELQALASRMTLHAELDADQARAFVRSLPARTGDGVFWSQPLAGGGLRLGASPGRGAFAVGAPERLRVLEPVLRHATGLRAFGTQSSAGAASWWEVTLPGARLGLGLSPALSRGFSGEGALLDALARTDAQTDLARRGLVGYDLSEERFFPRVMPYGRDVLAAAPRVDKARLLVDAGNISCDGERVLVPGSRGNHAVGLDPAGDTCTCTWYATHRGDRGPCAHVLAARIWQEERP
ncbi:MAG: SWIM zinc finger family protein [Cellulomonadaceae bacterium]|nr:SWIM zinc finger family protein [Cellulomonadaceae bacterium]